jgi:hypothetical protein
MVGERYCFSDTQESLRAGYAQQSRPLHQAGNGFAGGLD